MRSGHRGSQNSLPRSQWLNTLLPKDCHPEEDVTLSTLTSTLIAWHLSPAGSREGRVKVRISYLFTALCTFYQTKGKTARISLTDFLLQGKKKSLLTSTLLNLSQLLDIRCVFSEKKTKRQLNFCLELQEQVWEVEC